MSPIDDELRRVLAARSSEVALETDPLAGIEREAKSIRRRRTGTAVLGAALSVALVAIAVPVFRGSTDADARKDHVAGTPTPEAAAAGFATGGVRPDNAYSWHRDVPQEQVSGAIAAWHELHPGVGLLGGQGLWTGPAGSTKPSQVAMIQVWPVREDPNDDARTVTAVFDDNGAHIVGDTPTWFHEQAEGESSSATKDDVGRTTYELAGVIFDDPEQWSVLVTRPDVVEVSYMQSDNGSNIPDWNGGGVISINPGDLPAMLTLKSADGVVFEGDVQPDYWSVLSPPLVAWPGEGNQTLLDSLYVPAVDALRGAVPAVQAGALLYATSYDGKQCAVVAGEIEGHGYEMTSSSFAVGLYCSDGDAAGTIAGVHDVGPASRSVSVVAPGVVALVPAPGFRAAAVGSDRADATFVALFTPDADQARFLPRPTERYVFVVAERTTGGESSTEPAGQGLSFPDI